MNITLGDVTFNGPVTPAGLRWRARPPKEWWGGQQQVDVVQPTGGHGGIVAVNRTPAKPLVFRPFVEVPDEAAFYSTLDLIEGNMPGPGDGVSTVLTVRGQWLQVVQTSAQIVPWFGARRIEAAIELLAPYPFKRASAATTESLPAGSTATIGNAGTTAAHLTVTTTGAGTVKLRHVESGMVMQTRESVASGTVFDTAARRVTSAGGVLLTPMGSPSEWLSVPKGGGDIVNEGTAPVDITSYDTFS